MDIEKMLREKARILQKMDKMLFDFVEEELEGASKEEIQARLTIIFMAAIDYGVHGLTLSLGTPPVEIISVLINSMFRLNGVEISSQKTITLSEGIVKVLANGVKEMIVDNLKIVEGGGSSNLN